ncbi:MAG: hypothetical protein HDT12_00575 [Helicobacter sp.]|nr:hypothetical protein [Helicobacter sp.]
MLQEQAIRGNIEKQESHDKKGVLGYLPVSFFGACMGLSAMCVAWHAMSELGSLSLSYSAKSPEHDILCVIQASLVPFAELLSLTFAVFAVMAFMVLGIAYSVKAMTSFESCKQEFLSPITRPFFGTICISLLLLPFAFQKLGIPETFSLIVWILGAVLMLVFSVHIVQFWICHKFELAHITPAWIIPVVGLLDLPLALPLFSQIQALPDLGFFITIFCMAVGFSFTIVLSTLIFARIVFFAKLPDKLMPTLVVLLAPFGAGVSTHAVFTSMQALMMKVDTHIFAIDSMPYILFLLGFFLLLALLPQIVQVRKCCPFRITWWAISFPLAAMCIASIKINVNILQLSSTDLPIASSIHVLDALFALLSLFLLLSVTLVFAWLIVRTLLGIFRSELQNLA